MPPKKKDGKSSQVLPPKEAALFKQVVQFYEKKQYKKGIKAADQILKKHPDHGETLAMKGLTINCLGDDKKEEAYDLVKKGITFNMMSHVCWHVYGLLYRADRNYNQAIKSYNQALRLDKENLQILRDLALLQIHMRDLRGGLKTRHTLLTLKPTQRQNWMGFAMANHMMGRFPTAIKVIEAYENIGDENDNAYELSELLLYKNSIMVAAGDLAGALQHLLANEAKICDKLSLKEAIAKLQLQLEHKDAAASAYRELIDINVDNLRYHYGLQEALGMVKDDPTLIEEYEALRSKFPKSNAPVRIALDFTSGDTFKMYADVYIRKFLRRGIQSLFSDLKPLYLDAAKMELLSTLYEELLASLEKDGKFPATSSEPEPPTEGPMVLMWLRLLLANHYDKLKRPVDALASINLAIEHTPTCIELQLCKARIHKHHGNIAEAVEVIDKARGMDLADRYLNTRCTVYMLRADQIARAEKVVVHFTKEEITGGNNLYDMQCMWWETEAGDAFIRQGRYGEALKKLTAVEKHFDDIHEDQFDFHSYCLRKMTLRSYMDMLHAEDNIRTNKFFMKAAKSLIGVCLHLHDNPPAVVDPEAEFAGMDEKERKKAMKKKQKAEKAKAEAAEKAKAEAAKNKRKGPIDEDPLGEELLKKTMEDGPLTLATQYVKLLQQAWPDKVATHVLAYKVYRKLGKSLLCAQAILRARKIDAADPELHSCIVDFCQFSQSGSDLPTVVVEVVTAVRGEILSGHSDVGSLSAQYRQEHGNCSAAHMIAAAKAWLEIDSSQQDAVVSFLVSQDRSQISWNEAVEVHTLLKSLVGEGDSRVGDYFAACSKQYPVAAYFNPDLLPAPSEDALEGVDV